MVRALHEAGIEVILDVVYNHTAEGNHLGPTLSFRGIDNAAYYRLVDDDRRYYMDYTGTGNSLQRAAPARAAADHGLAALLGDRDARRRVPVRPGRRAGPEFHDVDRLSAFFDLVQQDPVVTPGQADRRTVGRRRRRLPGRQLPAAVDASGTASTATPSATSGAASPRHCAEFASRLTGSSDLYEQDSRRPVASINFVTAHDGFTLQRPGLLQRQAQRGQRRGQPGRRETTTGPGTAAPRAPRTTRPSSRCGPGRSATS